MKSINFSNDNEFDWNNQNIVEEKKYEEKKGSIDENTKSQLIRDDMKNKTLNKELSLKQMIENQKKK